MIPPSFFQEVVIIWSQVETCESAPVVSISDINHLMRLLMRSILEYPSKFSGKEIHEIVSLLVQHQSKSMKNYFDGQLSQTDWSNGQLLDHGDLVDAERY
jgi:hypothetical protein